MNGPLASLEFLAALLLIGIAGSRLSRYGAVIAARTRLGGTWIGLILLATITSLPELITGVSAVGLAQTADIAVGEARDDRAAGSLDHRAADGR